MRTFMLILLLMVCNIFCRAQVFYNQDIRRIFTITGQDSSRVKDSMYTDTLVWNDVQMSTHVIVEDSVITHAGYALFADSLLKGPARWIYRFIERKLLLYTVTRNEKTIRRDLDFSNAVLLLKDETGKLPLAQSGIIAAIVSDTPAISITTDSLQFEIMIGNERRALFFSFRKNGGNLMGTNKIEAEQWLLRDIVRYTDSTRSPALLTVSKKDTLALNDSVSIVLDGSYMDYFHSRYFVVKQDTAYKDLYDEEYPVESFITSVMAAGLQHNSTNVVLTHMQYGGKKYTVVDLKYLIAYLKRDHELYLGMEDVPGKLTGVLLACNRNLNYIHMLRFDTSTEMMFGSEPEYFCKLYAYIPTDNIRNLFGKYEKRKTNTQRFK